VHAQDDRAEADAGQHQDGDPHLHSCKAVMQYHIDARDGGIRHVRGLLVEEDTWAIRYRVVDTSNWWLGHQRLIAPQWIRDVRWTEHTVAVSRSQQAVKDAPAYDQEVPLTREQELLLPHKHHGRVGYWVAEAKRENAEYRHAAEQALRMSP